MSAQTLAPTRDLELQVEDLVTAATERARLRAAPFGPEYVLLWSEIARSKGALPDRRLHRTTLVAALLLPVPFVVWLVAVGPPLSWLVLAGYLVAGVLLLGTPWPGPLAAPLVLPYVGIVWPFRSVPDDAAESANRGRRQFLGANYVVGFLVTMLLIWTARTRQPDQMAGPDGRA